MNSLVKRNYRSELRRIDWDFTGENGAGGFAAYHWYPARYVPQLAGILVGYFSGPGDLVLDPFCGSGTTLIEAYKFGRKAVGIDLNPIAVLMTKAKLLPFDERSFTSYLETVMGEVQLLHAGGLDPLQRLADRIPNCEENRSWYHPETLRELACIWFGIEQHARSRYSLAGRAAFSAILKYCCSQEKHWGWVCDNVKSDTLVYKDALSRFSEKLAEYKSNAKRLHQEATQLQDHQISVSELRAYEGDCPKVLTKFSDESFDLVVTSPPYYNMTDYISSQRLSFLWFGARPDELRTKEIGARYKRFRKDPLNEYLSRMSESFLAIARVLKEGHFCCVVIGQSPRHKPFLDELINICRQAGLNLVETLSRKVSHKRSLSPSLQEEKILIMRRK